MPSPLAAFNSAPIQPTATSSLASWLTYLEQLHSSTIDLGLTRVAQVAKRLNLPVTAAQRQQYFTQTPKVVSVAGTNGKGSTLTLLQTMAGAQGLTIGTYTSPHFLHFSERIQLNGQPVSDTEIINAFVAIEAARLVEPAISLSYFEFATLAALVIFSAAELDLWLLEVGLGGRLDAVNLVDADLSLVITIAQDHADYLGTDLEIIGREKAGILRPGCPVVLGSSNLPASVTQQAQQLACPVYQLGQNFQRIETSSTTWTWRGQTAWQQTIELTDLPYNQLPKDNAATAVQALLLLVPNLNLAALRSSLSQAHLTGRMQRQQGWLLDVAHNPAAAEHLATELNRLSKQQPLAGKRLGYVGMLADKDTLASLRPLLPWVDAWVVTSLPAARALPAATLAQQLLDLGAQVDFVAEAQDTNSAFNYAAQQLASADVAEVLVVGSFFTVAQVLSQLEQPAARPVES